MNQNTIEILSNVILKFRCSHWLDSSNNELRIFKKGIYKIFSKKTFKGDYYYCIESPNYKASNYYMVKEQDLLPYIKDANYEIY